MKALSIKQPWAWLIAKGHKDIENRTWKTNFRGEFLIHAGAEVDKNYYLIANQVRSEFGIDLPDWPDLETGGVVGVATVTDCVERSDSPWWQDSSRFGFVIANAREIPFRKCGGMLQFFDLPLELTDGGVLRYVPREKQPK